MAIRKSNAKKEKKRPPQKTKPAPPAVPAVPAVPTDALAAYTRSIFPIVAVGASAGGLEPFIDILQHIPTDANLSLVFILHSDSRHASALPQVLSRATQLPVRMVNDGDEVQINTLHIVPPNREVTMTNGVMHVASPDHAALPIDTFLRSLAEDQGTRAISVILSGTASDGTLGSLSIKAEGGISFAQDETAKFDGMPQSAIAAGAIDFVLPPSEIAREVVRIAKHPYVSAGSGSPLRLPEEELATIFNILHTARDVDFTQYKPATLERRIRRRMALHKVEALSDYVTILNDSPAEVDQLYSDILIRVTAFFRDPGVFETLKRELIPQLMQSAPEMVRIWVPGCATGEEVYSLAIAFLEVLSLSSRGCTVQIFGTDVSDAAVERARAGVYPENIAADVSTDRLRRYFTKVENGYRVTKAIRDCCIFARQNLTKDPPFSKIDLISCRNVMIYLGSVLQRRILTVFHYALRPSGYLLLGSSETIGNVGDLFSVVDRRHKIYQKRGSAQFPSIEFAGAQKHEEVRASKPRREGELMAPINVFHEADRVLLQRFSPAGVVVNENLDILQFRGRTSAFLEPAPGAASFNLLKMAREGLLSELRTALHSARKSAASVRRENVRVRTNNHMITAAVEVIPFAGPDKDVFYVILFEEKQAEAEPQPRRKKSGKKSEETAEATQVARLKRELEATREYLQSIIEEQEAMNEELRSANEEIQSSNEELQSTNEELETAKEELQSSNEELTTLNEELENRNDELGRANSDLLNLLASVDVPIVMLDSELRIRRFNPGAQRALNLMTSDAGRSIRDLRLTLDIDDLDKLIATVIENLEVREIEAHDRVGHSWLLRVRPYKTTENQIEGAVMVMIDIDHLRKKM